jgi:hypothetical protein
VSCRLSRELDCSQCSHKRSHQALSPGYKLPSFRQTSKARNGSWREQLRVWAVELAEEADQVEWRAADHQKTIISA